MHNTVWDLPVWYRFGFWLYIKTANPFFKFLWKLKVFLSTKLKLYIDYIFCMFGNLFVKRHLLAACRGGAGVHSLSVNWALTRHCTHKRCEVTERMALFCLNNSLRAHVDEWSCSFNSVHLMSQTLQWQCMWQRWDKGSYRWHTCSHAQTRIESCIHNRHNYERRLAGVCDWWVLISWRRGRAVSSLAAWNLRRPYLENPRD